MNIQQKYLAIACVVVALGLVACGDDGASSSGEFGGLADGAICVAEATSDSSGYKLICGGEKVGVIKSKKSDEDDEGDSVEVPVCETEPLDDESGYTLICNGEEVGEIRNGTSCTAKKLSKDVGYVFLCGGTVVDTLRIDVDTSSVYGLGFCSDAREGEVARYKNDRSYQNGILLICEAGSWVDDDRHSIYINGDISYIYFVQQNYGLCTEDMDGEVVMACDYDEVTKKSSCTEKNGRQYICLHGLWSEMSDVEIEYGLCTADKEGAVESICENGLKNDDGSCYYGELKYICQNNSWRELLHVEIEYGLCTAVNEGRLVKDAADDGSWSNGSYECYGGEWHRVEPGAACHAEEGVVVENAGLYDGDVICQNGHWYEPEKEGDECFVADFVLNSWICQNGSWHWPNDGETCSVEGLVTEQSGCQNGSWHWLSDVEREFGLCTAAKEGTVGSIPGGEYLGDMRFYVCENGSWNKLTGIGEVEAKYGACTAAKEGTVESMYDYEMWTEHSYVCQNGSWRELNYTELEHGLCTAENEGAVVYGGDWGDIPLNVCENGSWRETTPIEREYGLCTEENEGNTVDDGLGILYTCEDGVWNAHEFSMGDCTAENEGAIEHDYGGMAQICRDGSWQYYDGDAE